jgi:CDP-glucose 4,6-dehydratase
MEKMVDSFKETLLIYRNKNVLVTGHTGFKGSWLTSMLINLGANVTGYSLDPITNNDLFNLNSLSNKINDIRGDIRDYEKLLKTIFENKIDIVFHLAAQPIVLESYKNPKYTFETNVLGTLNILEAIKNSNTIKSAVLITTDKVYSYHESLEGYIEDDKLGGDDPYSASKAACEIIIHSYNKSFFNKMNKLIASVRAGNVIGGGDWAENRLVPDCVRSIQNNSVLELRNPSFTRPWQHVLEPLSAYLEIGARLFLGENHLVGPWNIGPFAEMNYSVEEIIRLVSKIIPSLKYSNFYSSFEKPYEAKLLKLDISKSKHFLFWKPKLNIEQTLELTFDWYTNTNNQNAFDLTLKQILFYFDLFK